MDLRLGPDLSEQEWSTALQHHQEVMAEELNNISPDVERYCEVERAARGLFWSDAIGRIQ